MELIKRTEYNEYYFYGRESRYYLNAGYRDYDLLKAKYIELANVVFKKFDLKGKRVLEFGCAKGFIIENLRKLEVDAWGLDFSEFIVNRSKVKQFITVADARDYDLPLYSGGKFDLVFSFDFLECLPEEDIPELITKMNSIAHQQYHRFSDAVSEEYYTRKPREWWKFLPWKDGTVLISDLDFTNQKKEEIII